MIKHAVGMQHKYSTYGTDAEADFFYKASTPIGFIKSHNKSLFLLSQYVVTNRATALRMCLLYRQKLKVFPVLPKTGSF